MWASLDFPSVINNEGKFICAGNWARIAFAITTARTKATAAESQSTPEIWDLGDQVQ